MSLLLIGLAVAVVVVLFLVYEANKPTSSVATQSKTPLQTQNIKFTYQNLRPFDGIKQKNVYIALKGIVYDVTGSPFYQSGSGYHVFTGHDASVNLAKMSHDKQYLNKWKQIALNNQQQQILNDWITRFNSKYPKVGKIIQNASQ